MIKIVNVNEKIDNVYLEDEEENKVIKLANEDVILGRRLYTLKGKFKLEDLEIVEEEVIENDTN